METFLDYQLEQGREYLETRPYKMVQAIKILQKIRQNINFYMDVICGRLHEKQKIF